MCSIEKRGKVFILTLTGNNEHWLNPSLINSILSALSQIKAQATSSPGSVLITTSQGKFFSNGLDLPWILAATCVPRARYRINRMVRMFKAVVAQLMSFPMPTVAALSGHAAAAGLVLALSHDYMIMRRDRGVLYMSELDLGATLPDYFVAVARSKIGLDRARRDVLLRGVKVGGVAAMEMGIVESVHDGEDGVVEAALRLGEELAGKNWNGEVYAEIRKSLYPEISELLPLPRKVITLSKL